jgi:hypothetical protein
MAFLAIAGTLFGVYGTLFYERTATLAIDVVTNNPVFDIRTDVSKLGITYAGVDLRKASQTLRLFSVKIANTGNKDISKSDFDEGEPIALTVTGGKIVEISRLKASNDFLQRRGKASLIAESSIAITPVLLERSEFIVVDFLVLSDVGSIPAVTASGKIAGIKRLEFIDSASVPKASLITDVVHSDSYLAQLIRGPVYFLVFFLELIVLALSLVLPSIAMDSIIQSIKKWTREKTVQKKFYGQQLTESEQIGVEYFIESGSPGLAHLHKLAKRLEERREILTGLPDGISDEEIKLELNHFAPVPATEISYLKKTGLITGEGMDLLMSPSLPGGLERVCLRLDLDPIRTFELDDGSRFGSLKGLDEAVDMSMMRRPPRHRRIVHKSNTPETEGEISGTGSQGA